MNPHEIMNRAYAMQGICPVRFENGILYVLIKQSSEIDFDAKSLNRIQQSMKDIGVHSIRAEVIPDEEFEVAVDQLYGEANILTPNYQESIILNISRDDVTTYQETLQLLVKTFPTYQDYDFSTQKRIANEVFNLVKKNGRASVREVGDRYVITDA